MVFLLSLVFCKNAVIYSAETRILNETQLAEIKKMIVERTPTDLAALGEKKIPRRIIYDSDIVVKASSFLLEPDVLDKSDPEHKIIPSLSWVLQRRALALIHLSYDDNNIEEFFPILINEIPLLESQNDCTKIAKFASEHVLRIASMLVLRRDEKLKIDPDALAAWYLDFFVRYPERGSEQLLIKFLDKVKELNGSALSNKIMAAFAPRFAPILLESKDETIVARGKKLEAAARWFSLPGNTMQLTGTDINGNKFNLEDLKGKVVLVDFWGTWCVACVKEFPAMIGYYENFKRSGFEIVGVNTGTKNDNENTVKKYIKETNFIGGKKIEWKIILDGLKSNDERITTYYGIETLPQSALIGMDGKVIMLNPTRDSLKEAIQKALIPPIDPEKLTPEQRKLWEEKQRKDAKELEETKKLSESIELPADYKNEK
jgi:thiol-disulfide isomerase/thioredoxin